MIFAFASDILLFFQEIIMPKTLFINACLRENSRTLELANHLLSVAFDGVEEVKLYESSLAPLDLKSMAIRDEASKSKDYSNPLFDFAKQFASAEQIVVAAPYWDLSFPSILKVYFEAITVSGLTFAYGKNGIPQSLCNCKRLVYVTTAGGPIFYNFGFEYLSAIAKGFFGINEVECVKAEGLDIYGADVLAIMNNAKALINSTFNK